MRSSFSDVAKSSKFPMSDIKFALDKSGNFFNASHDDFLSALEGLQNNLTPVFSIRDTNYVPVEFGSILDDKNFFDPCFKSYSEFVSFIEAFSKKKIFRSVKPLILESLVTELPDGRFQKVLRGLVPYVNGTDLLRYNFIENSQIQNVFYGLALASKELSDNDLINIDIHLENVILSSGFVTLIDPYLVKKYIRPSGTYISDRSLHTHYSPEVRFGGLISDKSQVYSIGSTFKSILFSKFNGRHEKQVIWKKNETIITACTSTDPSKRPTSTELVKMLEFS